MTDDTCPDIPAELEQIAEDISMLWCGNQDANPDISQVMTIGDAAGQLRAHAAWLRAKEAAHTTPPRVTPLARVFDLIREERIANGLPYASEALDVPVRDLAIPPPNAAAGDQIDTPFRPRRAEDPQPPSRHNSAPNADVEEPESARSAIDGVDTVEPAPKRHRQVSAQGREAMRLSGRRLQERKRVARAAPNETTTCPLCDQTRLIDGEHLCMTGSDNGHKTDKRPARLQVIHDLGREGNPPPPWVANDPDLLAAYDEGFREARPTTDVALPDGDGEDAPPIATGKVTCPRCGRTIGTNRWGSVSAHKTLAGSRCKGAGMRPAAGLRPAPSTPPGTPAAAPAGQDGQPTGDDPNDGTDEHRDLDAELAGADPDEPAPPKRTITPEGRDAMRRNGLRLQERRRIASAEPDELTVCPNCDEARLIDGDHTCQRGRVVESITRPAATVERSPDPCTHSSTTDSITSICRKPAGHDGVCTWAYQPKEERHGRPPVDTRLSKRGGITPEQLAEVEKSLAVR